MLPVILLACILYYLQWQDAVNVVKDPLFTSLYTEDVLHGWWMDGSEAFSVKSGWLHVQCSSKALGLYQYIALPKTKRLDVAFTMDMSNVHGSTTELSFKGLIVTAGKRSSRVTIAKFNRSDKVHFTTAVNNIMVVVACVGYTGYMRVQKIEITPIISDLIAIAQPIQQTDYNYTSSELFKPKVKDTNILTLALHTSVERIASVIKCVMAWGCGNPVSIVLYGLKHQVDTFIDTLTNQIQCTNHLLSITVVEPITPVYPINYLRNLAISKVQTEYTLLIDADLVPSPLALETIENHLRKCGVNDTVYVIPVFETSKRVSIGDKKRLERLYNRGHVLGYKSNHQKRSHGSTDLSKWFLSNEKYTVQYEARYEPYIVMKTSIDIKHDERFTDYGWNKVAFITELALAGYSFVVLPDVWFIHIDHKKSRSSVQFHSNITARLLNRIMRYEWLVDIYNRTIQ